MMRSAIGVGLTLEADARRAGVIEFWRTVEMFSPQKVDKVNREQWVFGVENGRPLPAVLRHSAAHAC